MAEYVAAGRITQARPRFVGPGAGWAIVHPAPIDLLEAPADRQVDPRPIDERLLERWTQARDEWAQATFFLFDPNSWR